MKKSKVPQEDKDKMVSLFNAMDPDIPNRYAQIAKQLNRSTSTVFVIIKAAQKTDTEVTYFDPKVFQF